MSTWRMRCAWVLEAFTLLATSVQAVTIINKTSGKLLFYDDFEAAPAVSETAYPDAGGDDDPVARIGTWAADETGPTNVQVAAYFGDGTNDPAATPQGTNYLRVVRHTDSVAQARVQLSAAQTNAGDVIHTEAMVWIPGSVNWGAFQIQLVGSAGDTDYRGNVIIANTSGSSGEVKAWDFTLVTPNWIDSTLDWRVNAWQKWEIDYTVGATNYTLAIDGASKTLPLSGIAGDLKRVIFRCGTAAANMQFRLDATGYDGAKQDSFTLFSDGFESGTPDSAPVINGPQIGTYLNVGSGVKVRTGDLSTSGGPAAASSGNNYVELSRLSGAGLSLSCMFAGGAIVPDSQELRARFNMWWGGAGLPGYGISRATTGYFYSTNFLAYNLVRSDGSCDAYNGTAYTPIAPAGTIPVNAWFPVEIVWNPETQSATVSINNGAPITNVLFGAVPEVLNQLFLSSGNSTTVYWVDDVDVRWVYTVPPPPPPQGTLIRVQ